MKKLFIFCAAIVTAACERANFEELESENQSKKFTFTVKGDFSNEWKPVTRSYLSADGRELTDVFVLDYVDDELVQQLHQSDNNAEDFGRPSMRLAIGSHHVYFVASRGVSPSLDTGTHTLAFERPSDTFWADYAVEVVPTSNGNRAVTLNRVATRLRLTVSDEIPEGAVAFRLTPHTWFYGFDYITGRPVDEKVSQPYVISIPADRIGSHGTTVSIFGLSSSEEWTSDFTLECVNSRDEVFGSVSIQDAPFRANRSTEYSGPLFNADEAMSLSLNTDWIDSYTGGW
jgi:hypothetical protein